MMCAKAVLVLFMIYWSDELLNRAIDEDPILGDLSDGLKGFMIEEIMDYLLPLDTDDGTEAGIEGEKVLAMVDGMGMSRVVEDIIWPDGSLGIGVSPVGNLTPFPGTDWFHRIPRTEQALIGVLELGLLDLWKHRIAGGMLFRQGTTEEEIRERNKKIINEMFIPGMTRGDNNRKENFKEWRNLIRSGYVWENE